jgi:hypothetical protein
MNNIFDYLIIFYHSVFFLDKISDLYWGFELMSYPSLINGGGIIIEPSF